MSTSLLIGIPSYNGQVHHAFASSLASAAIDLHTRGINTDIRFITGRHLPDARNALCRAMIEGGCSHLLFADCDMSWPGDLPARLIAHGCDAVGAIYQSHRCGDFEISAPRPAEGGLREVNFVGTGMLMLSRNWCAAMLRAYGGAPFMFVHLPGRFIAEDVVALQRWRTRGGKVFADASCRVLHYGEQVVGATLAEAEAMSAATGIPVPMLRPGLPIPSP